MASELQLLAGAPTGFNPVEMVLLIVCFIAVVSFCLVGYMLFSKGWESYEQKYLEDAEQTLDDLFLTIPPQQLLFLSFAGSLFCGLLLYLLTQNPIISVMISIGGFFAPKKILAFMKEKRIAKFTDQLVEALTTLNNCLKSGFSLPKAFQLIADQMPKPLSQEFRILVQELRLGMDLDDALKNMYERVPSQDLDLLITAVSIANDVGGNLTEVFEKISFTIRERHRIEGRIEALTAQGKMQGIVVSLLPAAMFGAIYFIDPDMMRPMLDTWTGNGIIAVICVMIYIGYLVIKKICAIDI